MMHFKESRSRWFSQGKKGKEKRDAEGVIIPKRNERERTAFCLLNTMFRVSLLIIIEALVDSEIYQEGSRVIGAPEAKFLKNQIWKKNII